MTESHMLGDEANIYFFRVETSLTLPPEKTVVLYDSPEWNSDSDDNYDSDTDEGETGGDREGGEDNNNILEPPEVRLNLSQLKQKLQAAVSQQTIISKLEICCEEPNTWRNLSEIAWGKLCETLKEYLPNIRTLDIELTQNLGDQQWANLIQHLGATSIEKLCMCRVASDLPETFQQLGSLQHLKSLFIADYQMKWELDGTNCLSPLACQHLARSLQQLPLLQRISLGHLKTSSAACWDPVFYAIRSNPNLFHVDFQPGFVVSKEAHGHRIGREITRCRRLQLPQEVLDLLQFGPRLQRAKQLSLERTAGDNETKDFVTLEHWVEALVAVCDRIDCVDYLISKNPNMYALARLEALDALG